MTDKEYYEALWRQSSRRLLGMSLAMSALCLLMVIILKMLQK